MDFSPQNTIKIEQKDSKFREKIRQQAKQMVEKKRLAKRLSRTHIHTLQTQNSLDGTDDCTTLDKKIEDSIQVTFLFIIIYIFFFYIL